MTRRTQQAERRRRRRNSEQQTRDSTDPLQPNLMTRLPRRPQLAPVCISCLPPTRLPPLRPARRRDRAGLRRVEHPCAMGRTSEKPNRRPGRMEGAGCRNGAAEDETELEAAAAAGSALLLLSSFRSVTSSALRLLCGKVRPPLALQIVRPIGERSGEAEGAGRRAERTGRVEGRSGGRRGGEAEVSKRTRATDAGERWMQK